MLKYLAFMFFMMFILSGPAMLFFFYGTDIEASSFSKIVSASSMGNLGSSEPVCRETTLESESLQGVINLNCPFGELDKLFDFGQVSRFTKINCDEIKAKPLNEAQIAYYPPDCRLRLFHDYQQK